MDSKYVNKYIRSIIKPFLLENEFVKVTDRKYLKISEFYYFGIEMTSVGCYFSEVSGWPSQSIFSHGGIICRLIKSEFTDYFDDSIPINLRKNSAFFPVAHGLHHGIVENLCGLDQTELTVDLDNPANRIRKDLWWIDDSTDVEVVVNDIKKSILRYSLPYFGKFKRGDDFIEEVEKQRDCYVKFRNAYYLCQALGEEDKTKEYYEKYKAEAVRIGKDMLL